MPTPFRRSDPRTEGCTGKATPAKVAQRGKRSVGSATLGVWGWALVQAPCPEMVLGGVYA